MKLLITISLIFSVLNTSAQKSIVLNEFHRDSVRFYIGFPKKYEQFNYLEAAQKFRTENSGVLLERVELGRMILQVNAGTASIGEPSTATFILKIYNMDTITGAPGSSLIKEPLKIRNESSHIIKIDLKKYKILIPGKEFFVGIEWLKTKENQKSINLFERMELTPGRSFRKVTPIYEPFVGMINNKKIISGAWVKTPEGEWKLYVQNLPYLTDLAISAQISSH